MALALGIPDVYSMLRNMSWRLFRQWMEYSSLETFGDRQADWRMSIVASLIVNSNRDSKSEALAPDHFFYVLHPNEKPGPSNEGLSDLKEHLKSSLQQVVIQESKG